MKYDLHAKDLSRPAKMQQKTKIIEQQAFDPSDDFVRISRYDFRNRPKLPLVNMPVMKFRFGQVSERNFERG